jgi:hypothetical protein
MQLIASLIEAERGTAGVAGVETQTTPASRFRWPAVAADPIQRPCARAVSIAHTETPSEIVDTVKWGRRRGDNDDPVPATTAG